MGNTKQTKSNQPPMGFEKEKESNSRGIASSDVPLFIEKLKLFRKGLKANIKIFAQNPIGIIGVGIILFFLLFSFAHPVLINHFWDINIYDPVIGFDPSIISHPSPPSKMHLLGTDPLGRDILSQLMWSTSSEFILGIVTALITVTIATTVGAVSAFYGKAVDAFFMRIADIFIMMPYITILIVASALFDLELIHLAVVLGLLGGFGGTTIIIKSQALAIKVRPYIEAARVAGGSNAHIILWHMIPNLLPISFLYMMFSVTSAIFSEAILSFFGVLNIRMSWGLMIHTANYCGYLLNIEYWWLIIPASTAISMLCAAFYLVGRALDEVVNPKLRKR
jgi:peptide/nickel transport system permease protein